MPSSDNQKSAVEIESALFDLRGAQLLGLPFAACWNVNGFPFAWHVEQVRAGRRMLPSIRLPGVYDDNGQDILGSERRLAELDPQWSWLRENRLPVCLRYNNIAAIFPARPRLPLVAESIPQSPLVWRYVAGGAFDLGHRIDDTPFADPWGPKELWSDEGKKLGATGYVQGIARRMPHPEWVCLAENHEGSEQSYKSFFNEKFERLNDRSWKATYWWKTRDEIAAQSIRMAERFDQLSEAERQDAWSLYPAYTARYVGNYAALFSAVRAALPTAWGERLYVEQYSAGDGLSPPEDVLEKLGPNPQAACADGWGQSVYLHWYQTPGDLTDSRLYTHAVSSIPAWEHHREKNPRSYRVIYVSANSAKAVTFGRDTGKHEVVTPDRFRALCEWLLWLNRAKAGGIPVCLRYWIGSGARPANRFLPLATDPALAAIIHADYPIATARACDNICEHPTLREHWLCGETIPLPAPTAPQQVWLSLTRLGDETLLYAWTPCAIMEPLTVRLPDKTGGLPDSREVTLEFKGRPSVYMLWQPTWREVE